MIYSVSLFTCFEMRKKETNVWNDLRNDSFSLRHRTSTLTLTLSLGEALYSMRQSMWIVRHYRPWKWRIPQIHGSGGPSIQTASALIYRRIGWTTAAIRKRGWRLYNAIWCRSSLAEPSVSISDELMFYGAGGDLR